MSAVVGTLCDWAVTSKRFGKHRGVLVAKLLAMRQDEVESQVQTETVWICYISKILNIYTENFLMIDKLF